MLSCLLQPHFAVSYFWYISLLVCDIDLGHMPNEEFEWGISRTGIGPRIVHVLCKWQQVNLVVLFHVPVDVNILF
jgi:hypothetical protein